MAHDLAAYTPFQTADVRSGRPLCLQDHLEIAGEIDYYRRNERVNDLHGM